MMIQLLSLPRRSTWLVFVPALVLLAVLIAVNCTSHSEQRKPVRFRSLKEVHALATVNGLRVANDDLGFSNVLYVVEKPVPPTRLRNLRKYYCGLTPEWKGVVWVVPLTGSINESHVVAQSIAGHVRLWGNVLAAGDEDLLHRIEQLYRSQ